YTDTITAPKTGYIAHIQSEEVGLAAMTAGGGRETKDSVIDLSAGIVLNKKVGDFVKENEPLARLYANDKVKLEAAKNRLAGAYSFSEEPVPARPLIHGVITEKDI
ncbi:MAG: pyrimidine-nucleoside phosphorylase, partial [Lachnospira sp.]